MCPDSGNFAYLRRIKIQADERRKNKNFVYGTGRVGAGRIRPPVVPGRPRRFRAGIRALLPLPGGRGRPVGQRDCRYGVESGKCRLSVGVVCRAGRLVFGGGQSSGRAGRRAGRDCPVGWQGAGKHFALRGLLSGIGGGRGPFKAPDTHFVVREGYRPGSVFRFIASSFQFFIR